MGNDDLDAGPVRATAPSAPAGGRGSRGEEVTKQVNRPPEPKRGTPTAPPPPPAWRHYLWIVAAALFIGLLFVTPATRGQQAVTLTYTQFLHDVHAHKVKSVTIGTNGS